FYLRAHPSTTEAATAGSAEPDFLSDSRLRVVTEGDHLRVSWSRQSAAVKSVNDGVLEVKDGSHRHKFQLNSRDIATGSIVYRPGSDDVTFRLAVHDQAGSFTDEITR